VSARQSAHCVGKVNVCDDAILITTTEFLDVIHRPFFHFGDCVLFPSSGKSPLSWAQSIELVPIFGQSPVSETLFQIKKQNDG
jgi:hypothetical protein